MRSWLILCLIVGMTSPAWGRPDPLGADDTFEGSTRILGMGGAGIAAGLGAADMGLNPAALVRGRRVRSRTRLNEWVVLDTRFGRNGQGRLPLERVGADKSLEATAQIAARHPSFAWAGGQASTALGWRWQPAQLDSALELGGRSQLALQQFESSSGRSGWLARRQQSWAKAVIAGSSLSGRASWALAFKYIARQDHSLWINMQTPPAVETVRAALEATENRLFGVGLDAGLLWTIGDFWFPTIGLVVRNLPTGCMEARLNPYTETRQRVCGLKFKGSLQDPDANALLDPTDLGLGLALTPRLSRQVGLRLSAQVRRLWWQGGWGWMDVPVKHMVEAGAELALGNPLEVSPWSVRAGFQEGRGRVGVGLRLGRLMLEAAQYQIPYEGGKHDQRYMAQMAWVL